MKGRCYMNDERENITEINKKIKKFAIAFGSVALILAVVAVAATTADEVSIETTTSAEENVEAKVTNEPDTRTDETIIVPATEITSSPVAANAAEEMEESEKTASAPASYILPLGTDIGTDYSCGVPVYNGVMADWRTHDGVDFNGEYGDNVKCIADGTVKNVENDALMGTVITVDHGGGVVASYCGVEPDEDIIKGVLVTQGQRLGVISEIPCETDAQFPHLHLEIRVNGELSDPLEVMGYYE